jgi:hypothetical protein
VRHRSYHASAGTAFGVDEEPAPLAYMTYFTLEQGIKLGLAATNLGKFDFIAFDACLMSSIELVTQFAPYARYYMASEDLEPGTGCVCEST